jgi:hypothetical protein
MNMDDRRRLIAFLYEDVIFNDIYFGRSSGGAMQPIPTFATWQGLGNIKGRLVEKHLWIKFYSYAENEWMGMLVNQFGSEDYEFVNWLLDPSIFVPLVVGFLRKEKV